MRISDAYRAEQEHLHTVHRKSAKYGTGGGWWAPQIEAAMVEHGCASILDYGCGKGLLPQAMPQREVRLYDPGVPAFSAEPEPADMVTCLDCLEHIEPDCLPEVLAHLTGLAAKCLFVAISTKAAGRVLRDGRNAHLIVKEGGWWRFKIEKYGPVALAREYPARPLHREWIALFARRG